MSWGNVIGGAATLVGGWLSKKDSNKGIDRATAASEQAAREANALQREIWQQTRTDNEPFRQNAVGAQSMFMQMLGLTPYGMGGTAPPAQTPTGPTAPLVPGGSGSGVPGSWRDTPIGARMEPGQFGGGRLASLLQEGGGRLFGGSLPTGTPQVNTGGPGQVGTPVGTPNPNFQQTAFDLWRSTPGYQFNLDEGRNQLESSAAARGGLYSGKALKALTQYGQNYADRTYGDFMNRLASVANMGQTANSQNAQAGMNYGNNAGNNIINAGNTRASGLWQQGQNNAQFTAGVGGLINNGFQGWLKNNQWGGI